MDSPQRKDFIDALPTQQNEVPPAPYPPVTRHVRLPDKVSIRFLAEAAGQEVHAISKVMSELRIIVSVNRSVDFADAQKILRKYGIWAERGPTKA